MLVQSILLGIIIIVSLYKDIRTNKIPNWLTLSGCISGIVFHTATNSFSGFKDSMLGAFVGFAIMFILYLFGALGAGDVKLFAAIGAIAGVSFVAISSIYAVLFAGVIGLVMMLTRREFVQRGRLIMAALIQLILFKSQPGLTKTSRSEMLRFPFMYAVLPAIIAAGWEQLAY